jgi:ribose-phosphate pyrophosphokinase
MSVFINLCEPDKSDVALGFTQFPDGQPHVKLDVEALTQKGKTASSVEVLARLRNERDIIQVCLVLETVSSALANANLTVEVNLNLAYVLGARMDRRIAYGQPATLHVFAALLNACTKHVRSVRILDPHSPVALEVLEKSTALQPDAFIAEVLEVFARTQGQQPVVVIPDKGATVRTSAILQRLGHAGSVAACSKKRDSNTGKLSGFTLESGDVSGRACLIVDDICDGGGTFSGIADVLRSHGATSVSLAVTHGIFSKGIAIKGIDCVYATDSYGVPELPAGFETDRDGTIIWGDILRYEEGGKPRMYIWTETLRRIVGTTTT